MSEVFGNNLNSQNENSYDISSGNIYQVMDAMFSDKAREQNIISMPKDEEWPGPDVTTMSFNLPFYGRIRIVKDKAGLIASSFILFYWIYGNFTTWILIFIPKLLDGDKIYFLMILYGIISSLCLSSFFRVLTTNPGQLNSSLEPQEDWSLCLKCKKKRPPRTHHCRRCGQCVRMMDHHCPWVNNCVGEDNQYMFMLLVAYAYLLSLVTLVLVIVHLFYIPTCFTCNKSYFPYSHERMFFWIAFVMAIMMTIGGFSLYITQHISILFETSSMEFSRMQQEMILYRKLPSKYPKQMKSMCTIYRQVFGDSSPIFWWLPCRRRNVKSNSFHV